MDRTDVVHNDEILSFVDICGLRRRSAVCVPSLFAVLVSSGRNNIERTPA